MRSAFRWILWGVLVPSALCLVSALQARGVVALIEHGIGEPTPPPGPACPPPPPVADPQRVTRAAGASTPPPVPPSASALLGGARVALAPRGLALRGVRPGSLLDAIGLVDGDVITQVNGVDARRPEAALLALARLRNGGDFAVGVLRGERELVIRYRVR